jgi:hypothetical protein
VVVLRDLLPCPFGCKNERLGWHDDRVGCNECGAFGPRLSNCLTRYYNYSEKVWREGVAMLWNSRTSAEMTATINTLKSDPDIMSRRLKDPDAKRLPTAKIGGKNKAVIWGLCVQNVATFISGVEYKVSSLPEDPEEKIIAIDDDGALHDVQAKHFKRP